MNNRQIKFRIWNNKEKKWITDWNHFAPLWGVNLEDHKIFSLSRLDGGEGPYSYVVQQFTGLLDKNGKEIYEGDIVKSIDDHQEVTLRKIFAETPLTGYTAGEIMWVCEGWNVCQRNVGRTELHEFVCCEEHPVALEVIGNVYENQK